MAPSLADLRDNRTVVAVAAATAAVGGGLLLKRALRCAGLGMLQEDIRHALSLPRSAAGQSPTPSLTGADAPQADQARGRSLHPGHAARGCL